MRPASTPAAGLRAKPAGNGALAATAGPGAKTVDGSEVWEVVASGEAPCRAAGCGWWLEMKIPQPGGESS